MRSSVNLPDKYNNPRLRTAFRLPQVEADSAPSESIFNGIFRSASTELNDVEIPVFQPLGRTNEGYAD
jgi:hypothetical protein